MIAFQIFKIQSPWSCRLALDPSPKAWEAIIAGTIPIIEHSTLDDAYSQLPVRTQIWKLLPYSHLSLSS